MFFKKGKVVKEDNPYGRIYVLKFILDDKTTVWKVGMTHSARSIDRMFEILRSFFTTYRYVPKCTLRKDKKVLIPNLVEKHLHELLAEWKYTFDKPFDGHTEFFKDLDEEVLLEYLDTFKYNELLVGKRSLKTTHLKAIMAAIDSQTKSTNTNTLDEDKIPF
jgi:hypothetical protein